MWARLCLVCMVAMLVVTGMLGGNYVAMNVHGGQVVPVAKFGKAPMAEPVPISNLSPYIEPSVTADSPIPIPNKPRSRNSPTSLRGGNALRDDDIAEKTILIDRESFSLVVATDIPPNCPTDICSRQITAIQNAYIARKQVSRDVGLHTKWNYSNMGALKNSSI